MKQVISVALALLLLSGCAADGQISETSPGETGFIPSAVSPESSGTDLENIGESTSMPYDNVYPQHEPYGTGIGAMPGRVVWAHEPESVSWDGSGYWWEPDHLMKRPY